MTNIYQSESGGWICEVLLYPRDARPEWYRLGVFGTRAAAVAAARK
jgi:hypothetical protein